MNRSRFSAEINRDLFVFVSFQIQEPSIVRTGTSSTEIRSHLSAKCNDIGLHSQRTGICPRMCAPIAFARDLGETSAHSENRRTAI